MLPRHYAGRSQFGSPAREPGGELRAVVLARCQTAIAQGCHGADPTAGILVLARVHRAIRSTPTRVGKTAETGAHGADSPRSTPTRVGKTCNPWRLVPLPPVHPHACGENCTILMIILSVSGPPPRVWGKPVDLRIIHSKPRSTPTRVGKTRSASAALAVSAVHPHACGENWPSS